MYVVVPVFLRKVYYSWAAEYCIDYIFLKSKLLCIKPRKYLLGLEADIELGLKLN